MKEQLDRVSYSFGMKINVGNYESIDIHVSMSSDVEANETVDQALERVERVVTGYAKTKASSARSPAKDVDEVHNARDVSTPEPKKPKQRDPKLIKQQIKSAFALLEAQKKITKADFVKDYLNNQKVDQLEDESALNVIEKLKTNFKELGL